MTRRGCAVGSAVAVALLLVLGVWLDFARAYERERAVSPDGEWIATAYIDGAPLTAENERVQWGDSSSFADSSHLSASP
jgi:hypothetical protein